MSTAFRCRCARHLSSVDNLGTEPVDRNPLKIRAFTASELSVRVPTVVGMEILGERPAWSMNDTAKVSRLDATVAEINRLKTYYGHLVADLDASGYAKDIGAGDTARFLSQRYLIDPIEARRDVRLATALPKYDTVSAALPDPANPFPDHTSANTSDIAADADDAADAEATAAASDTEGNAA